MPFLCHTVYSNGGSMCLLVRWMDGWMTHSFLPYMLSESSLTVFLNTLSCLSCIAKIPFYSPVPRANTHAHPHRHLWPLSVECYHLCGVEWVQLSLLTARCMQLNRIKVISPTEVIASRWLPCRNMLLMKLLSHCGCVRLWHSKRELACVYSVCWGVLPFGYNTRGSTWLDSGWSFSGSIPVSACY